MISECSYSKSCYYEKKKLALLRNDLYYFLECMLHQVLFLTQCYLCIAGSGSSYLYALLDHEWKEGMSQEEAEVCRQLPSYLDPEIEMLSSVVV